MIILTLRTDKPESELGLFEDKKELVYETWQAHRQLAETIHIKIQELFARVARDRISCSLKDVEGVVVYKGPGSFTGLRIGISVANALADGLSVPTVGVGGENWREAGINKLLAGIDDKQVLPDYGGEAFTTPPKK